MIDWIIASVSGLALGWMLYFCVRLRAALVPIAVAKVGIRGSYWVWFATVVIMIAIGNLSLIGLRNCLSILEPGRSSLAFEIWFAIVGFVLGLYLVTRRAWRRDCSFVSCR